MHESVLKTVEENLIGKDQKSGFEGWNPKPYPDSLGYWTIGLGTNIHNGLSREETLGLLKDGITHEQALWIFRHRLNQSVKSLERLPWFVAMDDCKKPIIIEMVYQIGLGGVLDFKKMIAAIERKDYHTASREMLNSLWAKQTRGRAEKLAERMFAPPYES